MDSIVVEWRRDPTGSPVDRVQGLSCRKASCNELIGGFGLQCCATRAPPIEEVTLGFFSVAFPLQQDRCACAVT